MKRSYSQKLHEKEQNQKQSRATRRSFLIPRHEDLAPHLFHESVITVSTSTLCSFDLFVFINGETPRQKLPRMAFG